ncbi:MAG: hypothetical protein PHX08_18045 [Lachnospiraceae bacterium]|nr:hypothetical protein [Lachnospiraceae bacterium]
MNKTYKWNNASFRFSAMDADTKDKFNKLVNKAKDEMLEYEKVHCKDGMLDADGIRAECDIFDKMFDEILGNEASKKMFSDKDLYERVSAYNKIRKLYARQIEEYNELVQAMENN